MNAQNDSDLSRLYRDAEQPEPTQALDDTILTAAHKAASQSAGGKQQRARAAGGAQRWRVPLALAASVVLSVAVTTLVVEQQPGGDGMLPLPSSAQQNELRTAPVEAKRARAQPAQLDQPPAKPAYAPVAADRQDAGMAADKATAASGALNAAASSDAPAESKAEVMPAPAAAGAMPALREMRAKSFPLHKELDAELDATAAAVGTETPEQWIAKIRALTRAGRSPEAMDKLAEFKKRFPDYPLPDDLK